MTLRYLLVLDESGQRHVRDPKGRRFAFIEGGLIVREDQADALSARLDAFKDVFADGTRDEVKSHDLAAGMGPIGEVADFEHQLAQVALAFEACDAILTGAFLDKTSFFDSPDGALVNCNSAGELLVNQQLLFETLTLMFGTFLAQRSARGDVMHDELGGAGQHEVWLSAWDALAERHPREHAPIDRVEFVDSRDSNLVQLADIAIGVLRTHYERRVVLRDAALALVKRSEAHGLLLNVQP